MKEKENNTMDQETTKAFQKKPIVGFILLLFAFISSFSLSTGLVNLLSLLYTDISEAYFWEVQFTFVSFGLFGSLLWYFGYYYLMGRIFNKSTRLRIALSSLFAVTLALSGLLYTGLSEYGASTENIGYASFAIGIYATWRVRKEIKQIQQGAANRSKES